ncbi:hypothetical protein MF672_050975 (plasmid) [Actinomadura sp. ATCC 31491]|uniref:Uncharacterized protein n=1 Tax=Actinomadura luzonensis TaxID=2805427 RepID=A0ABT0GBW7_9ACTN|nr:hypothetical protein [Actinomadura luzonensis]MCK2222077.1 hypothetical protein [Actinomadura luzonensis]
MDLDAARRARAAKKGGAEPLIIGGDTIAVLPAEFPLDVLEPLITGVDLDIALLARSVVDAIQADNRAESGSALISMIVDMVITNPGLPAELLSAAKEMLRRLIGADGYDRFVSERPSREDLAEFVRGLFAKYGWADAGDVLGESMPPADGSPGGTTSTPTSGPVLEDSTSTESGPTPEVTGSSGYAASLPTASGSLQMP